MPFNFYSVGSCCVSCGFEMESLIVLRIKYNILKQESLVFYSL